MNTLAWVGITISLLSFGYLVYDYVMIGKEIKESKRWLKDFKQKEKQWQESLKKRGCECQTCHCVVSELFPTFLFNKEYSVCDFCLNKVEDGK